MTPKEKALQIFLRFKNSLCINNPHLIEDSKQGALICVDMAIEQFVGVYDSLKFAEQLTGNVEDSENYKYWQQVKKEIELL